MRSQPDLSHFREPETVGVGDTLVDLISGLTVMLFVIAVGFWTVGVFS
jgi:hypothetical protein